MVALAASRQHHIRDALGRQPDTAVEVNGAPARRIASATTVPVYWAVPATMRRIARSAVVAASWRLVERSVVDLRLRRGGGGDRRRPMRKAPRTTVSSSSPQVNSIAPGPLASAAA